MSKNLKDCSPAQDIVKSLVERPLTTREISDQVEIVNADRPIVTLSAKNTNCDGSFKRDLYCKYDWICGCTYYQTFHCWPCLLFAEGSERWMSILRFNESDCDVLEKHAKEESHRTCVVKLAEFKLRKCKKEIGARKFLLEDTAKKIPLSEEKTSRYALQLNRKCAHLAVEAIVFMVKKQMPFAQKDDSSPSPSNYVDFLHLLLSQSQNDELKNHFKKIEGCVNPILTKSMLQGVVESVSECILEQIKVAVEAAEFFSLRIDDGLDELSDCSLFIRTVNPNNELKEFLIGCYSLGSDNTSLPLIQTLKSVLEKYEYKSKLIGICFDITCVKFKYLKEVHEFMKSMTKQSIKVNLFGHCLDYIVEKCLNRIPTCRQFFANLNELLDVTKALVKRNYLPYTEELIEACSMNNTCCSKFKLLSAMIQDWIGMFKFFQEVQQETVNLEDVLCLVSGISAKLKDDQFVFLAVFLCHIFDMTNTLYQELVDNPFDPMYCKESIKHVCYSLCRKTNDTCYEAISTQADQILRECSGANDSFLSTVDNSRFKSLFNEILECLYAELHSRFENTDHTYFEIGDFFRCANTGSVRAYWDYKEHVLDRVKVAKKYFPKLFKETKELENELTRLNYVHGSSKKPLLNLIYELRSKCGEQNSFAHAYRLMTLIALQTPSTQKLACLHEFSNYLKDSDIGLRPYLAVIVMNKDILVDLSSRYSFKDDILNKLSINFDAIKVSHMVKVYDTTKSSHTVKSLEKRPEVIQRHETNLSKPNPTTLIESAPGPSTQMEPDSSLMEQDVHLAMTCEIYPADEPLINIKKESIEPDKQDILSASVMQELRHFSKEPSSTSHQEGSLFQPPVLIKEEPIFSEDES